jgi:spindle assembly abnormal protein 6
LAQKSIEIDKLKLELDSQSERMLTKHMQDLNVERDKSLQNQSTLQQKWEKEKKDIENAYIKNTKAFEIRISELEAINKDLLEKKYKNESQLQEFRIKNAQFQEEQASLKQEIATLRKQNTTLDSEMHTNEKTLNSMRTRIAVLEQELKDKTDSMQRMQEMLNAEQAQHKQADELVKDKSIELKKKQAEINHYVEEFKKGNEIVIKLQAREKTLAGQLKLKTRILTEQEKVMKEKEKEIDELKHELKELKEKYATAIDESKELKSTLQKKNTELEEAVKLLKKNEGSNKQNNYNTI